jgi:D-inositol-3-phosphate glycosyltransferase
MARLIGEEQVVVAADMLVANTDDEAKQLIGLYDADPGRVEVVHPGVDLARFRDVGMTGARERLGLPTEGQVITFVGRIQPLKAPDVMLRAVAVLLERRPELRSSLTVAVVGGPSGSGLDKPDSLVRLAEELGIDRLVRFVPPVKQDELVDWYAASSLVCVPSYNESFGLVAIEAQATGTPVVAAAVGGLTTAVHDERSGLLVADHEPASYAVAFERVLFEPGLYDVLAAGAEAHAQQFGWDRTADMMLRVYAAAQEKMRADLSGIAL